MQYADTEKVIITSGAAGEIELTMHIEISNTGAISFVIDPNVVTATKKDLADHNTSQTAHAAEFEKKADVTALNDHANNSDIHVNPTTMGNYDTAIAGLIDHTEDTEVHVQPASGPRGTQARRPQSRRRRTRRKPCPLLRGWKAAFPAWKMDCSTTSPETRFLCNLIPSTGWL